MASNSPLQAKFGYWYVARGDDLIEAFSSPRMKEAGALLDCEAIYLWKRAFRPPATVHTRPNDLVDWLSRISTIPYAEIHNKTLSHFAWLDVLAIKGMPLSEEKRATLISFLASHKNRRWFLGLLAEISRHSPPLYVGETNRLVSRVREHIRGESNFGSKILASGTLDWRDLDLYYYAIGEPRREDGDTNAKKRRTAIEMLIVNLTLAGYVERRG